MVHKIGYSITIAEWSCLLVLNLFLSVFSLFSFSYYGFISISTLKIRRPSVLQSLMSFHPENSVTPR
ncbi:hypothetical protein BDV36DRAFT_245584 [Aspergillus pseudocaelatus]|uniref:Uncharacterized protein n=1 Tax=Aspergillus pseudocaelatus TaxID=1825620 RepID=A0ABQ6WZ48_9EURO|nr:hypothetical protein BDV36DRAFT_245584 [Aspergillus pseudocaelatus]